jgi:uncharacterized protein YkwD
VALQTRSGATGDNLILRRYARNVKLPGCTYTISVTSVPGKHRPHGESGRSMFLHVIGLGAVLLTLLVGGVIAMDAGGTRPSQNVITDTLATPLPPPVSTEPSGLAGVLPSSAPVASGVSPSVEAAATTRPPAAKDKVTTMEDEVTALINKERDKAGCGAVRIDERMRKAGRAHSADMAVNKYFSHTGLDGSSFVDRLERAGYPRSGAAGENIAYGYGTAQAVVTGWMNSDGHRRNILNCSAKATGVGLAYRGTTPYWTQLFGRL